MQSSTSSRGAPPPPKPPSTLARPFALTESNHGGDAGIVMRGSRAIPRMPNTHQSRHLFRAIIALVVSIAPKSAIAGPESPAATAPAEPDPMLSPTSEAPRRIASWNEALALIRDQSPDYVSSYESVVRAEAQRRTDLRGERNIAVSPPVRTYGSYGCTDCYAVLAIRPGTESMPYQRWMGAVYRTVGSGNNV